MVSQLSSSQFKRVAVAMSGGVDSSMAAALLLEQGYEVFGVHMHVKDAAPEASEAAADARKVAAALGIELRELDLRQEFRRLVIEPFIAAYLAGQTPNPCVGCNRAIKFGLMLDKALAWGADALATGHYARVQFEGGRWTLRRATFRAKDQSYYLSRLRQDQLARFLTPLGRLTKPEIRQMARDRRLPVAEKSESQDICFIPDNDYKAFIEERSANRLPGEGDIVSLEGKILGRHGGAWRFTIGQRQGLGVSAPHPLYVTQIDMERNRVIVGPREATFSSALVAEDVNYVSIPPLDKPLRCEAQIRYRHAAVPAMAEPLDPDGARLRIVFDEPQSAITPGQAAALYQDDLLLAGGWIAA
ncbi:MAG: tRNA 2-thiouridine(34) synthase MnmA [Candidatus Sumerlaeota bacterium]|nr:tRNA 2-thiouridine(34) synthase MnmA [Candidatus Sumerlaeota bacterium]